MTIEYVPDFDEGGSDLGGYTETVPDSYAKEEPDCYACNDAGCSDCDPIGPAGRPGALPEAAPESLAHSNGSGWGRQEGVGTEVPF